MTCHLKYGKLNNDDTLRHAADGEVETACKFHGITRRLSFVSLTGKTNTGPTSPGTGYNI